MTVPGPEGGGDRGLPVTTADVLVVEDDANYHFEFCEEVIQHTRELATFIHASTLKEAIQRIDSHVPDLIVLDIIFPIDPKDRDEDHVDFEAGVKLLRHIAQQDLPCQVIVLSSQSKNFAVNLLIEYRAVLDYIFKDASWSEIRAKISRHLEAVTRQKRMLERMEMTRPIVGRSPAVAKVKDLIARVARKHDTTVLITGQSGTGKELVANHIHMTSGRRHGPFVVVNCGAIPEGLMESELFGYVPGAFTGATRESPGKVEQADRGTLFLDEIGELPPALQVKLLRVLQNKVIQRLGDSRSIQVDLRVIAATNRDLEAEVASGRFREDLFYRLNVLPIEVPPLAERREDIPLLARSFLDQFNAAMEEKRLMDDEALEVLAGYEWAGNVRELRNIIERLMIIADGPVIGPDEVRAVLGMAPAEYDVSYPLGETDYKTVKREVLQTFNRKFVLQHLRANGFNILKTAKAINYNRQDLSTLIKSLGIEPDRDA